MRLTTKLSALLVLALLVIAPLTTSGLAPTVAAQDEEPLRFVFVTHDLGAGIFAPVRRGMEDACALIGAECEFLGPQTYDPAQQVSILEAAIATNPDGIATTRPEPGVYDDVIKRAQEAGIEVDLRLLKFPPRAFEPDYRAVNPLMTVPGWVEDGRLMTESAAICERIAEGTYGDCIDCGVAIPLARLQVQPAAARCIACQERHEQTVAPLPPVALGGSDPETPRGPPKAPPR